MSAIKFSKQYIEPNPREIDYWVDLSSNQYGGRWRYYNGVQWVDLINQNGTTIDSDKYYTKLQINEMLSNKASTDSVDTKVDDTEVSEVIKDIEIRQKGDGGIELVLFKYDNTTVGVTLPIASSTSAGVVTAQSFENIVKQNQLQQLYTEMYDKLAEIRSAYQKKLKAGSNIIIDEDTNTIHATGDISADWDNIHNKPEFKLIAVTGDYNDLTNKLKAGRSINISPDNTISVTFNIDDYATVQSLKNEINDAKYYTDVEIANLNIPSQTTQIQENKNAIATLTGSDTGKSTREIVQDEVAKQLESESISDSFDTLQEMAEYLSSHPQTVTDMNAAIVATDSKATAAQTTANDAKEIAQTNATAIASMNRDEISGYITKVSQVNGKIHAEAVLNIPATDISVTNVNNYFTATNVESALNELYEMWDWEEL